MSFSNLTKVEMLIDGTWTSIKENIDSANGIVLNPHKDGTFLVGTFDAWLTNELYVAYTPIRIAYNSSINYVYLVAQDSSKPYLLESGLYHHSFELYEATALLSNFIVGTKVLSLKGRYTNDYASIHILLRLMQYKYGVTFNYSNYTETIFNKAREFSFGPGTTLYTALCEIMEEYDFIPIVKTITSATSFSLGIVNRNNSSTISYSTSEITDIEIKQDMDDYCKHLECEASNVVDRTNTTKWKNLSVRADDILINNDTCCLLLPCNVEEIKKIEVNETGWTIHIYLSSADGARISQFANSTKTLDDILYYLCTYNSDQGDDIDTAKQETVMYRIIENLYYNMYGSYPNYTELMNKIGVLGFYIGTTDTGYDISGSAILSDSYLFRWDVTDRLLEKSEWDALDVTEKPKYMYYESGTNVIKGMYNYYNYNIWGLITGGSSSPWYNYVDNNEVSYSLDTSSGTFKTELPYNFDVLDATFNIEAIAITDPFIICDKTISPLNESTWKPYSRSYDNKASKIEFDKLEERMKVSNNMLGDVELKIELTNPSTIPYMAGYTSLKMTYNNVDYYVLSYVVKIMLDNVIVTYNLSRTFSKKAEVIGVDTQFEATPNPLGNIVTRPIYIEAETGASVDLEEYNFLKFKFYPTESSSTSITLYKRFSLLQNGNDKLLYTEAIDQYAFDYNYADGAANNYYRNPVSYVNSYNEVYGVHVYLAKLSYGDGTGSYMRDMSKKLPELISGAIESTVALTSNATTRGVVIYKDAREHLTFTIKLN